MTTKRFLATSAAALVLGFGLAGCGGQQFPDSQPAPTVRPSAAVKSADNSAAPPIARLLAVSQRTEQARTARLAIDVSLSGLGTAGTVKVAGSGLMDLSNKRLEMKLGAQGVVIEMRVIGDVVYINSGGRWISAPALSAGTSTPIPSDYLDYLPGIAGAVHTEGHETLRGIDTTRYGATVDLDRALAHVGTAAQRATVEHALAQFGLAKFPVTVWVDSAGRLRKMKLSIDLGAVAAKLGAPAGSRPKIDESIELYDFGVPVQVDVPAGAQSAAASTQDVAAETDLRNALTAEKTIYTDRMTYTADVSMLKQIEPSLDWGRKVKVVVGGTGPHANSIVCMSERSKSGLAFAIADVSEGALVGTYYGKGVCPAVPTARNASTLGKGF